MKINKKDVLRMCVVTHQRKPKEELIRIVKNQNGKYYIDNSYLKSGRSAYISKNNKLINEIINKKILNRSFKTQVPTYAYELVKKELSKYEK